MIKQTQTIPRQQSTNCLSVIGHFVGLAFKGLTFESYFYFGLVPYIALKAILPV